MKPETKEKRLPAVIKIAVVDDQHLFRTGMTSMLKDYEELNVIVQCSNGKELMQALKRHTPHVVLLDIEMPVMNGVETTELLRQRYPDIKIIILTMYDEEELIYDLINKGAHGFLLKDNTVDEVVDAIYSVVEKGSYYNRQVTEAMVNGAKGLRSSMHMVGLNEREIEIIRHVCGQKTNKEIADSMNLSIRTIENLRNGILAKTGSKNTAGMVMYALKNKLISNV
ncbi:MAG: response regulator transcription factor [Bacteroidia bacterium]|nr:response regulator transcription factor [Bacteroidia bacterium]